MNISENIHGKRRGLEVEEYFELVNSSKVMKITVYKNQRKKRTMEMRGGGRSNSGEKSLQARNKKKRKCNQ